VLETYKRHADRFGPDGVVETAAAAGLTLADLVTLQQHVDELEAPIRRKRGQGKHRLTAEARVKRLLGIPEETESQ
jgi:hypothetical protein